MNCFLNKKKNSQGQVPNRSNYGLSSQSSNEILAKGSKGKRRFHTRSVQTLVGIVNKHNLFFNRFLRTKNAKRIQSTKKQSSWKALRIRQGLPMNGQRTHTNARTAKRWVGTLEHLS